MDASESCWHKTTFRHSHYKQVACFSNNTKHKVCAFENDYFSLDSLDFSQICLEWMILSVLLQSKIFMTSKVCSIFHHCLQQHIVAIGCFNYQENNCLWSFSRVPQNCFLNLHLLVHDPDGDDVRCKCPSCHRHPKIHLEEVTFSNDTLP